MFKSLLIIAPCLLISVTAIVDFPKSSVDETKIKNKIKNPYRIAEEKCVQYSNARYVNKTIPSAIVGQPSITRKVLDCLTETPLTGGPKALAKELPHMALIGTHDNASTPDDEFWVCGGTLISSRFVLSAAHCTTIKLAKWVRLGAMNRDDTNHGKNFKDFRIVEQFIYPEYKQDSVYHDIALLKLENDVQFSPFIRPLCLHASTSLPSSQVFVSGWGVTEFGGLPSNELLKIPLKLMPETDCQSAYKDDKMLKNGYNSTTMICAGNRNSYIGPGFGGSPLQIKVSGFACMWAQIGIDSYGPAGPTIDMPEISTKVWFYIPWIQSIVWP